MKRDSRAARPCSRVFQQTVTLHTRSEAAKQTQSLSSVILGLCQSRWRPVDKRPASSRLLEWRRKQLEDPSERSRGFSVSLHPGGVKSFQSQRVLFHEEVLWGYSWTVQRQRQRKVLCKWQLPPPPHPHPKLTFNFTPTLEDAAAGRWTQSLSEIGFTVSLQSRRLHVELSGSQSDAGRRRHEHRPSSSGSWHRASLNAEELKSKTTRRSPESEQQERT